jgi:nicotinate-nucleotide pyrophosphorylase (carboxylating)
VTARLLGEEGKRPAQALVRTRENGVFCGTAVLEAFAEELRIETLVSDGQAICAEQTLARLNSGVAACLSLERTLLNLLSHLCGIATVTHHYVEAVGRNRAKILATRKTLPGLRELQLMAVKAGGGWVHRRSLSDGILIKDNHLACLPEKVILQRAKENRSPLHAIEIEVQSLDVLSSVLQNPPDVIMLDNLSLPEMKRAMEMIDGRSRVEVSGGISLDRVKSIAELGVDYISVGALTHSVKALDLTLDIQLL